MTGVRTTKYDPSIDLLYPPEEWSPKSSLGSLIWRDASPLPQWLLHPNYSILTACSPHEIAEELEIETSNAQTKMKKSALSYFLLEALVSLRTNGVQVSQSSLYQHLLTKFHVHWPQKTPMRRGNEDTSSFGKLQCTADLLFIPISRKNGGCINLEAGLVHDVHEGDEYALSPFDVSEKVSHQDETSGSRFRVDHVGCFTSELSPLNPTYDLDKVETGWKASLITRFPAWTTFVRIFHATRTEDEWIAAAANKPLLSLVTEDDETRQCLFNLLCDSRSEYEVLDASLNKIPGIPAVPIGHEGAIDRVIDTLDHLTKFKRFEGIVNCAPSPSFERSFTISSESPKRFNGYYHIKDGDEWQFCVENCGQKPLYLIILTSVHPGRSKTSCQNRTSTLR